MPVRKTVIPPDAEGMKTGLFLRRLLPSLPESVRRVRTAPFSFQTWSSAAVPF